MSFDPSDGGAPSPVDWRGVPIAVETNVHVTQARESWKRPITFRQSRTIDPSRTWMFTDGSGSGWHGLVVLRPGCSPRLVARETRMAVRNVGAEMNGLLMALGAMDFRERVTVVSDYLWSIYYVLGWRAAHHSALVERVPATRGKSDERRANL